MHQTLLTVPHTSLSLVSELHEADSNEAAAPLFVGTVSLDLVDLPPSLPPRPSSTTSSLYHDAIPGGYNAGEPSRSPSPSPSFSPQTRNSYLRLSLTLPDEQEAIFTMPVVPDSHHHLANSSGYLLPNLTGSDPSSLAHGPAAATRDNGWIKLELPSPSSGFSSTTEDRESFESILQTGGGGGDQAQREGSTTPPLLLDRNQLYIVDEKNGTVLGQLDHGGEEGTAGGINLEEDSTLSNGQMQDAQVSGESGAADGGRAFNLDGKEAVVINSLEPSSAGGGGGGGGPTWNAASSTSSRFSVKPLSSYTPAPNPDGSTIISVGNFISHGLVIGSSLLSQGFEKGAGHYVSSRPATDSPLVFKETTKSRFESGSRMTGKAVVYSGMATGYVAKYATNLGDKIGKATGIQGKPGGPPPTGLKGLVAKSLVAINQVGDALDTSGKALLESGSKSASQVVHHKWGGEARGIADDAGSSVKHCALVYIDARGVTRRALIKAVGKGALKAKMADGSQLYLTDSSEDSTYELKQIEQAVTPSATTTSTNPFDHDSKVTSRSNGAAPPSYDSSTSTTAIGSSTTSSGSSTPVNIVGGFPTTYKPYNAQARKDQ